MTNAKSIISTLKIIIVDDELDSVTVASDLLAFYGAEVHTASNGRQALELVEQVQPDLILSDISMPEMDGLQLITAIRQNPATANLPVIALTARAHQSQIEQGLKAGFTSYLTKPISALTLVADIVERVPSLAGV